MVKRKDRREKFTHHLVLKTEYKNPIWDIQVESSLFEKKSAFSEVFYRCSSIIRLFPFPLSLSLFAQLSQFNLTMLSSIMPF